MSEDDCLSSHVIDMYDICDPYNEVLPSWCGPLVIHVGIDGELFASFTEVIYHMKTWTEWPRFCRRNFQIYHQWTMGTTGKFRPKGLIDNYYYYIFFFFFGGGGACLWLGGDKTRQAIKWTNDNKLIVAHTHTHVCVIRPQCIKCVRMNCRHLDMFIFHGYRYVYSYFYLII